MRHFLILLSAVVCAAVSALGADAPSVTKKPVVKIGVILPLSGDNDHLGQPLRELIQYKVAHFPKDSRFEYKLYFEDDQLVPRQTLLAAHRLWDLENVDVLMTFFTGPGSVVAPLAVQKKKVHLMFNFKEEAADATYNFIHVTPMDPIAKLWTQEAERRGYKKVAFMVHRNAGGEMALKALEKFKPTSKLEWVNVTRYNQGEIDFRIALWKIREKNPEILFLYGFEPELPIILRQMREIGWNIPVTSISVFELVYKNPMLEGAWWASFSTPTPAFAAWYDKTFRKDYPLGGAIYSDWVDLVHKGFEGGRTGKKLTGDEFAEFLRGVKGFDGASGPISMDVRGIFVTQPTIMTIKNGKLIPTEGK